jgi:hypothetical protein
VAISRYNVDQTGPNAHDGGVPGGFRRPGYQIFTDDAVETEPIAAAPKQMATNTIQAAQ